MSAPQREAIQIMPKKAAGQSTIGEHRGQFPDPIVYRALLGELEQTNVRAVSFDVFDTVITRRTGEPSLVYLHLGIDLVKQKIISCTPETFMRLRMAAETRARRNWYPREVTLKEIYAELVFSLNLEPIVETLMDAELRAERETICVIPEMRATVDIVRRKYGRVLYISDMYLPQEFLAERLRALGLLQPRDRLYVSSSQGCWKRNGDIYRKVLEQEGLRPGELFHCGNSLAADVVAARRAGLSAHHYTHANPNASEDILNGHALCSEGITGDFAGTSRLVRLQGTHFSAAERVIWDTAASVTGPLVLMFARWIIDRATQKGIKKLLFLARDAHLPCLAVKTILAEQRPALDLELHYIHGSRATYTALGIQRLGEAEWDVLYDAKQHSCPTVNELRNFLKAEEATFAEYLTPLGLGRGEWNRPLQGDELARIKRLALEDANFNRALVEDIQAFRRLTRRYFIERGLGGEGPIALVDSGWSTRSHAPLFRFLEAESGQPIRILYFGVNAEQPEVPIDALDTFLYNRATSQGAHNLGFGYARAMETLMMAGHGRTTGFEESADGVKPVLAPAENREFIDQFFTLYERAVVTFVKLATPLVHSADSLHDHRKVADQLINRFWSQPTNAEARAWSILKWEADPHGMRTYSLARPYRYRDAWMAFVQRRFPDCYPQFWVEGAIALTPWPQRMAIAGPILLRRCLARVIRVFPGPVARCVQQLIGYLRELRVSPKTRN